MWPRHRNVDDVMTNMTQTSFRLIVIVLTHRHTHCRPTAVRGHCVQCVVSNKVRRMPIYFELCCVHFYHLDVWVCCGILDVVSFIRINRPHRMHTGWAKNGAKFCLQNFFTRRFLAKFAVKCLLKIPPHLAYVATLPCETLMSTKEAINDKLQGSVAAYLRWRGC